MPKLNLNPCFKHWEKYDNIFIISDTHFGDVVTDTINGSDYREKNTGIKTPTIEEQVAKINKVCHKNDLLIILGDIGNIEPIKKLKAGYKVLIKGNHDIGSSNYQRIVKNTGKYYQCCPQCGCKIIKHNYFDFYYNECDKCGYTSTEDKEFIHYIKEDNHLFDEVYPGICSIREDIVLSHEVYDSKYCLNIHGHDHNCQLMKDLINGKEIKPEEYFDTQLNYCKDTKHYYINLCSEWINYEPINLKKIINSGILKEIPNIHREAIDKQIENPVHNKH